VGIAVGVSAILWSNTGQSNATPISNAPAEVYRIRDLRFTGARKREVEATVSRFVQTAVLRRNLAAAWKLASPNLRSGVKYEQWVHGDLPVVAFPRSAYAGASWKLDYAHSDDIVFDVLIASKADAISTGVFALELKPYGRARARRWLVESWVPRNVLGTGAAPVASSKPARPAGSRQAAAPPPAPLPDQGISKIWLLIPGVFVGLILLVPLGFAFSGWRARRAYRSASQA
jgi:hypothetical protein